MKKYICSRKKRENVVKVNYNALNWLLTLLVSFIFCFYFIFDYFCFSFSFCSINLKVVLGCYLNQFGMSGCVQLMLLNILELQYSSNSQDDDCYRYRYS